MAAPTSSLLPLPFLQGSAMKAIVDWGGLFLTITGGKVKLKEKSSLSSVVPVREGGEKGGTDEREQDDDDVGEKEDEEENREPPVDLAREEWFKVREATKV